jgi:hypothetical protein
VQLESALIIEIAGQKRLLTGGNRLVQRLLRRNALGVSCSPRSVSGAMVVLSWCVGCFRNGVFMRPVYAGAMQSRRLATWSAPHSGPSLVVRSTFSGIFERGQRSYCGVYQQAASAFRLKAGISSRGVNRHAAPDNRTTAELAAMSRMGRFC